MSAYTRAASACRHSLKSFAVLGERLTDEQWHAATDCPAWTVGDIYAHVIGVENWAAAGCQEVTGKANQEWIDQAVNERRGAPREAVLVELRELISRREPQLTTDLPDPDAPAWWPLRHTRMTHGFMLSMRAFDLWVHEQDVRRAIGWPGNLGSPGARATRDVIFLSLPRTVAKSAGAPPGSTIRITTIGELPADVAIHVDADGRGMLVPADTHPSTAHVTLSWDAFAQLSTGRGSRDRHQVWLGGDHALADRVVDHLNIAP